MGACTNTVGKSPSKNQSNIIRVDGELRAQQKNFNLYYVEQSNGEIANSVSFKGKGDHQQSPQKKQGLGQQNAQNNRKRESSDISRMKNIQNHIKQQIDEVDISNNPQAIQPKSLRNSDRNDDITLLYDPNTPLPVVFELSIEHAESGLVKSSQSYIRYCPAGNDTSGWNWQSMRQNGGFRKRDQNIKSYI